MKKSFSRRNFMSVGTQALGAAALANTLAPLATAQAAPAEITRIDLGYAWVVQGAGCNVFVIPGMNEGGALMVDGGLAANSDALLAAVKDVAKQDKIHTLINTHFHPEQTGSNERVGAEGGIIIAHENTKMCLQNALLSATYEGRYGPLADVGIPTQTVSGDGRMKFAGQEIIYGYLPAAHTNGDIFLYFPILDTLITGGPLTVGEWPVLDYRQGGFIGGLMSAYDKLSAIVSADTIVIPAHGPVTNGTAVVRMRNMYSELHLTLAEQLNIGMGWDDIVTLNPLKQYEEQYGSAAYFLETAHRSMQMAYVPD
jgi:cyclase